MLATQLFKEFFKSEKSGGLVLIGCTVISLVIANSAFGVSYHDFWLKPFLGLTIEHWINDGLMAIFFLLIGLELEREIYQGELSKPKDAMLPVMAAIGGMLIPASIYLFFNYGADTQSGAGVPMATDIAFALGVLSLLGNRVPTSLKIFLTALAVIDDLGAIIVIAIFYSTDVSGLNLIISLSVFGLLLVLNRLRVHRLWPYLLGGLVMWYFMLHSGVHATITGVLLAFAIPFTDGGNKSPSYILQHWLHKPVAFIILPIFALANTAIIITGSISDILSQSYSVGVALGLIIGKPLGVFCMALLAVKTGICSLPSGINWKQLASVGCLAGIGFTMSIFITLLAFTDSEIISHVKLIIMISSLIAGVIGYIGLQFTLSKQTIVESDNANDMDALNSLESPKQ